jgi:glucosamine kinase
MGGLADQMAKRIPADIADLLVPARYDAMHGAILLARQHERAVA